MENEFHEMNDLNVEEPDPDPDPEDEGETSFTREPFDRLITEVNDLNTRVDKSVKEVRSMQAESERALLDNAESLKELVQKQRAENAGREGKRLSEIIRLRKKTDRLTKRENIELEEIGKTKSSKTKSSKTKSSKTKREKIAEIQRKLDKLTKREIAKEKEDDERIEHETSFINSLESGEAGERPMLMQPKEYEDTADFFTNALDLEPQCSDPRFIDYLTRTGILGAVDIRTGNNVVVTHGDFKSVGDMTDERADLLRGIVRNSYDNWSEEERRRAIRKSGIVAAIGLGIIALVTGLSVGLTRKGSDMVHQAKKWEKLTPAKKIGGKSIPWTSLEKATGRVVIFTGEHILIVMVGISILVYSK